MEIREYLVAKRGDRQWDVIEIVKREPETYHGRNFWAWWIASFNSEPAAEKWVRDNKSGGLVKDKWYAEPYAVGVGG